MYKKNYINKFTTKMALSCKNNSNLQSKRSPKQDTFIMIHLPYLVNVLDYAHAKIRLELESNPKNFIAF